MKLRQTDRKILGIAMPAIVSNITVPLLGLVDVAIAGHLGSAAYIGAIAVGTMVFNVIYWVFGFLRMGTSGLTAQALGGRNLVGAATTFARSLMVALVVAAAILVLQVPLGSIAIRATGATGDIAVSAHAYFRICVWGAPAMLGLYALTGWFIGMQNTRIPMLVSIVQNVVNIVASLVFVYAAHWRVEGIAAGTLVAQYAGLLMAALLWAKHYGARMLKRVEWGSVCRKDALLKFFAVNRDIFLRTLFLVAVNFSFLSAGAAQGAVILAVNTLLMQLFTLFSYIMDGFAYAGEALCGRLYGAGNVVEFRRMVRRLFIWGGALTAAYTLAYAMGGSGFLSLLTDDSAVIGEATHYFAWAVLIPVAGVAAFVWDGVFIGITATRGMLAATAVAAAVFFAVNASLAHLLHNNALWLAFLMFLFTRGAVQTFVYGRRGFWNGFRTGGT